MYKRQPLYTAAELNHPFNDHAAKVGFFWDKVSDVAEHLRLDSPLDTVIAVTLPDEMPAPLRYALKLPIPKIKAMKDKLTGPAPAALSWKRFMSSGGMASSHGVRASLTRRSNQATRR